METKDYITLAIAILGVVLGIINTYYTFFKDRERLGGHLSMGAACWFIQNDALPYTCHTWDVEAHIEVINFSSFPVTIREIALFIPPDKKGHPGGVVHTLDKMPLKIEARSYKELGFPTGIEKYPAFREAYAVVTTATQKRTIYKGRKYPEEIIEIPGPPPGFQGNEGKLVPPLNES